jgi:hypothetical protein
MLNKDPQYVMGIVSATEWFRNLRVEAQDRLHADLFNVKLRLGEEEEKVRLVGVYEESVASRVACSVLIVPKWNEPHPQAQFLDGFSDRVFLDELEVV